MKCHDQCPISHGLHQHPTDSEQGIASFSEAIAEKDQKMSPLKSNCVERRDKVDDVLPNLAVCWQCVSLKRVRFRFSSLGKCAAVIGRPRVEWRVCLPLSCVTVGVQWAVSGFGCFSSELIGAFILLSVADILCFLRRLSFLFWCAKIQDYLYYKWYWQMFCFLKR